MSARRALAVRRIGCTAAAVAAALVREVFGLESVVVPDPVTGSPLVVPGSPWSAGTGDRAPVKAEGTGPLPADLTS